MKKSLYLLSTLVIGLLLNFQFARAQVVPEVTVIQPSEMGIEWVIGNTYLISWTDNFTMPVDIYLVDDDFGSTGNDEETLIGEDVEGSTFAWTISNTLNPGNQFKVEVRSAVNPAYKDDSEEYFSLVDFPSGNTIHVEQPNIGGISWVIGETYLISWTIEFPGNVDIYLTDAAGTTDLETIDSDVESSTYWWNTATHFSQGVGSYRIRIASHDDPTRDDVSDNSFSMVNSMPGTIELLQPTANNTQILVGSTYLISWIDTFSEDVKIELTSNDVDYYEIAASVEGSTYLWNTATLPAGHLIADGGTYKIKVSSTIAGTYDDSEFAFTAVSSTGSEVTVIQPSEQNIEWLLGGQYLISWIDNFSGNVNIELWDATATNPVGSIATNVPGSTYIWNTAINPAALDPGSYTIKITNSAGTIADFSDNAFDIVAGTGSSIEVLQPSIAGINWVVGSSHLISWIDDVSNPVDIELVGSAPFTIAYDKADNYGGSWADGDNEGYGFGAWEITSNVTDGTPSAFIDNPADGMITGMDDPSFGIAAYSPTQDPNNWIAASRAFSSPLELENTFSFDWGIYGPNGHKEFVLFGDNGSEELLKFSIDDDGSHDIKVTYNSVTTVAFDNLGTNVMHFTFEYLINGDLRVRANSRDGIEADFDETYPIAYAPDKIRFFASGQLDNLPTNLNRVNWFNNFKIQTYIADIATDVEGSTYVWNTTGYGAGTYKIRVKSGDVEGESDNTFNLVASAGGTLTFEAPLPGAQWVKGASYWVSWNDTYMEPLDIYLRRGANGVDYNVQLKNDFEGSAFVYDVVAPEAEDYYIYIASSTDPSKHHESGLFDIILSSGGTLTFESPLADDQWLTSGAYLISWNDTYMEPLNVYLRRGPIGAPTTDVTLKPAFEGTSFYYDVAVPAAVDYYIYIESSLNPDMYHVSGNFDVIETAGGTITMLQPVGSEVWVRGNTYFISWNDDLVEPVDVWLKNDDLTYSLQMKNDFAGTAFDYTLPGTLTPDDAYYVQVASSIDPGTYHIESGDFTIISSVPGTIDIQQPNGGEFLTTGTQYLISWIDDIAESVNIKVYQFDDNLGNGQVGRYEFLNVPGSTKVWNILPTYTGSYFKVRIKSSDPLSTTPEEWSDGYFSISAPVAASVYPNPAKDFVSINFDENVSGSFDAVLYDRFNNQMMNFTLDATTKSHRISTAQLPEGVYFLRMTSGSNTIAQKIIVQH